MQEACAAALALLEIYQAADFLPRIDMDSIYHCPYAQLMALLVFAAHQCFQTGTEVQWKSFNWLHWCYGIVKASAWRPAGIKHASSPLSGFAFLKLHQKPTIIHKLVE